MQTERKLALGLLVSLSINIFLAGVLGGQLGRDDDRPTAGKLVERREHFPKSERENNEKSSNVARHNAHVAGPRHGNQDRTRPKRGGFPSVEGPSDLVLLRQMIQIMGGPKDPRIVHLREQQREDLRRVRSEMQAAHKRVRDALTSEKADEDELRESLKHLRKTAFESQARAQEGILTLARLMTPEERARLRDLPAGKDGEPHGPPGRPANDKRPAL